MRGASARLSIIVTLLHGKSKAVVVDLTIAWMGEQRHWTKGQSRSDPAPHTRLVLCVLRAELALQICFFALDHAALHNEKHDGQRHKHRERVDERSDSCEQQRKRQVDRVARVAEGSAGDDSGGR